MRKLWKRGAINILIWSCMLLFVWDSGHAYALSFKPFVPTKQLQANVSSMAFDHDGYLYILDSAKKQIKKYDPSSRNLIAVWGGYEHFIAPNDIAVDSEGNFYVTDSWDKSVSKFNAEGDLLAVWRTFDGGKTFTLPTAVAVDKFGQIYVSDNLSGYILKFDSEGEYMAIFGGGVGFDPGQFNNIGDIAVDSDGNLYVVELATHRVQIFTSDGSLAGQLGTGAAGSGNGELNSPSGIAFDESGLIYIADGGNGRIQIFDQSGYHSQWGVPGSGEGDVTEPRIVAVDRFGHVYVTSTGKDQILIFDQQGDFLTLWAASGSGSQFFNNPIGIDVSKDYIAVSDLMNHRVKLYDKAGNIVSIIGSSGSGDGQFNRPYGVALDEDGNIYVADTLNSRIQKFSSSGAYLRQWNMCQGQSFMPSGVDLNDGMIYIADILNSLVLKINEETGDCVAYRGEDSAVGKFSSTFNMTVDAFGNIYVLDSYRHNVHKFDADWNLIYTLGKNDASAGNGDGEFNVPFAAASDAEGNLYVADAFNHRVQKFSPDGHFIEKWGEGPGLLAGQFFAPQGIAVDSDGTIYVSDSNNNRIQISVFSDAESVAKDLALLDIVYAAGDSASSVTQDVYLPNVGMYGTAIMWVSDMPDVIGHTGKVTRPDFADGDATVKLTATITKGSASDEKTFLLTVLAKPKSGSGSGAGSGSGSGSRAGADDESDSELPAAIEIVEGTDGEVSGIIHPSVIVKEAGSDDAVTENVIFTPEMMRIVMDIAGYNKHHQAPLIINDTEDGVRVQFPAAELANAMSEIPEIELEIILNGAGYQLKIAALELDKLAERLGVTLEDLTISVLIGKADDQTVDALREIAAAEGFDLMSDIVDFSIIGAAAGETFSVDHFGGEYVTRTIVLDDGMDNRNLTAVRYDPTTGTVAFIPSVRGERPDGTPVMIIMSPRNSLYAVIEGRAPTFVDISEHWSRKDVALLASKRIIQGVSQDRFAPDAQITRAEFTALLVRSLGLSASSGTVQSRFSDVAANDWFAADVEAAFEAGLASGVSEDMFAPDRWITREQMAVMFARSLAVAGNAEAAENERHDPLAAFADHAEISAWARDGVTEAVQAGIVHGKRADMLAPSEFATRAEAAAMLKRFLLAVQFIDES